MLKLSEFSHDHHPSGVKMVAKNIRRGISLEEMFNAFSLERRSDQIHSTPVFAII